VVDEKRGATDASAVLEVIRHTYDAGEAQLTIENCMEE